MLDDRFDHFHGLGYIPIALVEAIGLLLVEVEHILSCENYSCQM